MSSRQYLILAPRIVRADTTYRLSVRINELSSNNLTVRAILTRNQDEYATGQVTFTTRGNKQLLVKVRTSAADIKGGGYKKTMLLS